MSTVPGDVDAVVIGAGPNGLVAANLLADAGWDVLVLEEQPQVGGAVRSDRAVHPDFVHDTFSAFYPLAAASPVLAALDLERHGLQWRHAPAVLGHAGPDGSWTLVHRDPAVTADLLDHERPGDGAAWLALLDRWHRIGPALVDSLLTPWPPVRAGARAVAALPAAGGIDLVRRLLAPAATVLDRPLAGHRFGGRGARLLVAGNAAHADIGIGEPGSGLIGLLLSMLGQTVGFPVPAGGAGRLGEALLARLETAGGRTVCGARVQRVLVEGGRATGVVVGGARVRARRAVLAAVGVHQLAERLLGADLVPPCWLARVRAFRLDPGTVKVDWALSGPVPWAAEPRYAPGTVHLGGDLDELRGYQDQLAGGLLPDRPLLLLGQMSTADPTRSPAGGESVWAYTHVPQRVRGDAAGELDGDWDGGDDERFADRMQALIEAAAPGFGSRVLARRVLSPPELHRRDANLVGGALNGGSAALDQQAVFRPVAGSGRPTTPVRGLFLASASAHPGGAVHGACGANAARAALAADRVRGRRP